MLTDLLEFGIGISEGRVSQFSNFLFISSTNNQKEMDRKFELYKNKKNVILFPLY